MTMSDSPNSSFSETLHQKMLCGMVFGNSEFHFRFQVGEGKGTVNVKLNTNRHKNECMTKYTQWSTSNIESSIKHTVKTQIKYKIESNYVSKVLTY